MERTIIESAIINLPSNTLGEVLEDHQIWTGNDAGAMYKVTRHILPTPDGDEMVNLTISGMATERARLIEDFKDVLGPPIDEYSVAEGPIALDSLAWLLDRTLLVKSS